MKAAQVYPREFLTISPVDENSYFRYFILIYVYAVPRTGPYIMSNLCWEK